MSMKIITTNIAGGDAKTHRTIEAAARRIANPQGYGGFVVDRINSVNVDADAVELLAQKMWEEGEGA